MYVNSSFMKMHLKREQGAFGMTALNDDGQTIRMDASPGIGGEGWGLRPMETVLAGLGGCSAIDIISILRKQKQEPEAFEVALEAQRDPSQTPSVFRQIHVIFRYRGAPHDKVVRAAALSMEKYCSVTAMLQATATITHSVEPLD